MRHVLALDQGTTSSRAILFAAGDGLRPVATAQEEIRQICPAPGWVEHDAEEILATTLATARRAIAASGVAPAAIAGIGITNQRETTILWDRATGKPLHNAIVWQDRRTAARCAALDEGGHGPMIAARTGLLLDPYFSASKLAWLLDTIPGARGRAQRGELAFGTVDSWLLWHLTGEHTTDATNAARTMLFDIGTNRWDEDLCALFDIPPALLPEVRDCAAPFGICRAGQFGAPIPVLGVAGDQQAAALGQACFAPGMVKATFGTGLFALLNTGGRRPASAHRLLATIAARLDGRTTFALEGSVFIAGAVVQWLRDGLGVIAAAHEADGLARAADPAQGVVMVPAFTGLGAPWWRPEARGAILGLTRATGRAEMVRAALESVAFQARDLFDAMRADTGGELPAVLRVDGGFTASDWTMQFLADLIAAPVDRPAMTETTALGAAFLAARQAGLTDEATFARSWRLERRFTPGEGRIEAGARHARWQRAVSATLSF